MTALLRAEIRKTLTTRSALLLAVAVVIYPALSLLPAVTAAEEPAVEAGTILQVLRGSAEVLAVAVLLLGVLAAAGEHRHGTIVPSLLAEPRRARFLGAKLAAQAAMGATLGLVVSVVGLAVGGSYLAGRDVPVDLLSADVLAAVSGVVLVATLYAAIGTAVGALVRNQTAAVAGVLVWISTIENVVPVVLRDPGLKRWLPGGGADRLFHLAEAPAGAGSAWTAVAMLACLTALLAGAAAAATRSADVH
jgi:ABC-2 type transport system permease protein